MRLRNVKLFPKLYICTKTSEYLVLTRLRPSALNTIISTIISIVVVITLIAGARILMLEIIACIISGILVRALLLIILLIVSLLLRILSFVIETSILFKVKKNRQFLVPKFMTNKTKAKQINKKKRFNLHLGCLVPVLGFDSFAKQAFLVVVVDAH